MAAVLACGDRAVLSHVSAAVVLRETALDHLPHRHPCHERLDGVETDRTRSDLESLFLAIVRHHDLPAPEVNVKLGRWAVDFLWRAERVVVETDFFIYHRGSVAFEDDHARDLDLRCAGYTVLRFTDRQLEAEPERVAMDVARALSQEVAHPLS